MVNLMDLHDIRVEEQDLSSGDLTITASDNESLEILARGISGGADDDIIQEAVDEETMLAYPATDGEAEVFPEPVVQNLGTDIHAKLRDMGLQAPTIKVPEGDEYQLINDNDNGTATVLYRQGNATMVNGSAPGGPDTKTRTFITSAEETQQVAQGTTETITIETSQNPGILRDFPYEEDVPAQREYDLQAVMLTLDSDGSGGNITLDSFRLQAEEREFLAKDSAFVDEALANYPNDDLTDVPLVFPAEPTFGPGDELDIQVEATEGGTGDQDAVVDVTMIFYRRGVGGV
jgi:hypothetical protein